MNEEVAMRLLTEANPVRADDLTILSLPDYVFGRRGHSRRTLAAVVVVAVVAATLIGVFAFGKSGKASPSGAAEGLPGPTVAQPLAGGTQVSLSTAAAALGPVLVLPDTPLIGRSDAGPVWMFANRDSVIVAVTFPKQGMFIDYSWPSVYADPAVGYRALVQDNRPNFHLIDLSGVPAVEIDENSDDTGHSFGVVAFTVGSTEISVFGHEDQTALATVAASVLNQMPPSARASSQPGSPGSVSLEEVPIALHASVIPPDTPAVQPSEAAPLGATNCPARAHTSNPPCQVTIDFPAPGLSVGYSRPAPTDPRASYQKAVQESPGGKIVSLRGVPALFVAGRPSSIEFVVGATDVTVRGNYDEVALQAIAQSILDRS
jgi:hypothetical protein